VTPKRHRTATLLSVVAVVLIGALAVLWYEASHSDPVSEDEVVERFRDGGEGSPTRGGPAPGVYMYDVTGREEGGAGPIRVSRSLPAQAAMTVTATDAGWQAETVYSRQHVEAMRLAVVEGDVVMSWRRVDVTFAGFGRDDRRDIDGVARVVRDGMRVGDRWTDRYRTGTLDNTVHNRVLRRERIVVGGHRVDALVISSDGRTSGALSGTRRETFWWVPERRLVARSRLDVEIHGVFGYSSTIDARLQGLAPVR